VITIYSPELANPIVTLDRTIIKTGEVRQAEEVGLDSKNRKAICLSIKVPIKDVFGNLNGLIGISIDITDYKMG
jgi:hypothetical protein